MNLHNKIKKPYLLYVGNAYPHKNLERLLKAFKLILDKKPYLNLILVGKMDYFYQRLGKLAKKLGLKDNIIFIGQVSDKELDWLYSNALIYVFPSLNEGFGLPGLEAMSKNLPVVCSNHGPLPEIYGSAAVYFNPEDIKEMASIILKVINNNKLMKKLKIFGQKQVKKYSWQKCAQETLNVYESIFKK